MNFNLRARHCILNWKSSGDGMEIVDLLAPFTELKLMLTSPPNSSSIFFKRRMQNGIGEVIGSDHVTVIYKRISGVHSLILYTLQTIQDRISGKFGFILHSLPQEVSLKRALALGFNTYIQTHFPSYLGTKSQRWEKLVSVTTTTA